MPNNYPEWQNFQLEPNNHYRLFFLHTLLVTTAFRLEYMMFYQFYPKLTTFFRSRNVLFHSSLYVDVETSGRNWSENDVKMSKMTSNHHTDVMHEGPLTPPHVRRHFLAPIEFMEIPVWYARNSLSCMSPSSTNCEASTSTENLHKDIFNFQRDPLFPNSIFI